MPTGQFVVLEGLDGSGTTTQGNRLVKALQAQGKEALFTFEPSDLPVGLQIREVIERVEGSMSPQILPWLFVADRADHLDRVIEPAVSRGAVVVSDRYLCSSLAYQTLNAEFDLVASLNSWFRPADLTIFLDVPVDVCIKRIEARRSADGNDEELFDKREALERIDIGYRQGLDYLRGRGDRVEYIDGTQSIDDIAAEIFALVDSL